MSTIFETISDKNHEQVIYCNDPLSGLKAIIAIHIARNRNTINKLIPTLTSETTKNLHLNPLTRYKTGLNKVTLCQRSGSMIIE